MRFRIRHVRHLLAAFLAVALLAPNAGVSQTPQDATTTRIAYLIEDIRTATDGVERNRTAAQLAEFVAAQSNPNMHLEAWVIDNIAALLSDSDDWVRFYAAASLGFVGPPARRAIPQLERALERSKEPAIFAFGLPDIYPGLSSANAICAAFGKIDLSHRPAGCEDYR